MADDHVFAAAIRSIYAGEITQGCDSGARNYCPDLPVTRGQMAAFLTRALGLDVPPAVPGGVVLERMPSTASAHGTRIEVCRIDVRRHRHPTGHRGHGWLHGPVHRTTPPLRK